MQYYIDGKPATPGEALALVKRGSILRGYDLEDVMALWAQRRESEEARDFLFELSNAKLEFDPDEY